MDQLFGTIYNLLLIFKFIGNEIISLLIFRSHLRHEILCTVFPNWIVVSISIIVCCTLLFKAFKWIKEKF
jgi:hypothetical protein